MQDQEFPSQTPPRPAQASFDAVMHLLAACGHLHTMLHAATSTANAPSPTDLELHNWMTRIGVRDAASESTEDEAFVGVNGLNLWIDRAHKMAQVLGFADAPASTDLGAWIDNLPPPDAPRYLLPSGERTGNVQKALNEWYSAAPPEIREAAETATRIAAEQAYASEGVNEPEE